MSRRPEIKLPDDCYCPIGRELMEDPVMAADGHTYERDNINTWLAMSTTDWRSPLTNVVLDNNNLIPNHTVRKLIEEFSALLMEETQRRELAEDRLAQAESHLKNVLTDLSSDELATVPVTIEAVIDSFHGVGLFAPPAQLFDPETLQELLTHISLGHQEEAEEIIIKNPDLLEHATTITDHADRELKLKPFQLALFYRDWHMWQMIRRHMDLSDAAAQLKELEEHGTPYGTHYDFSELLNAYKTYQDRYKELGEADNWEELNSLWLKIGKQQARAPLHVLQEFFIPYRSFEPTPKFDETEGRLPRAMEFYSSGQAFLTPRKSIEGEFLGVHFAFVRYNLSWQPAVAPGCPIFSGCRGVGGAADSLAVAKLCETRSMQYENLKAELLQAHAATPIFLR